MRLLEKIEELTLHAISQEEEIQGLRASNVELEERLDESAQDLGAELRARMAALEQALGIPASGAPNSRLPSARPSGSQLPGVAPAERRDVGESSLIKA